MKKNKPFKYPKEATPEQVGKLAENLEREFQMTGENSIKDAKIKKIKKFEEPELNKDISKIAESRVRYETLRNKRKPPEIFEKNNSGLAGLLQVSKRIKTKG